MKKIPVYALIIFLLLFYTDVKAEVNTPAKINIGIITRINYDEKTVIVLTGSKDFKPGQIVFADIDGRTIELRITGIGETEIICEIPENDIKLISEGLQIYSKITETEKSPDSNYDDNKEKDEPRRHNWKKRPEPLLFIGVNYNSSNFQRGSDFYGEKSGVTEAYANMLIDSAFFHAGYENPGLNYFNSSPENYKAVNLSGSYSERSDLPFTPYFKLDYKHLPDAEKIDKSSFATGTLGVFYNLHPARIGLSYSRDYYTDDLNGDRETFKDYILRFNLSLYKSSFLISNAYWTLNIVADYYNNQFEDSLATTEDESRRGFSDITAELVLNIQLTDSLSFQTEYNYAYMPDSDWSRYTKSENWYGVGINLRL